MVDIDIDIIDLASWIFQFNQNIVQTSSSKARTIHR